MKRFESWRQRADRGKRLGFARRAGEAGHHAYHLMRHDLRASGAR